MLTLDQVVPWDRSIEEYRRMFALSDADLQVRILGCADGPASFNAAATRRGIIVTSIDPSYRFDAATIVARCWSRPDRTVSSLSGTRSSPQRKWGRIRMQAMQELLGDTALVGGTGLQFSNCAELRAKSGFFPYLPWTVVPRLVAKVATRAKNRLRDFMTDPRPSQQRTER